MNVFDVQLGGYYAGYRTDIYTGIGGKITYEV